MSKKLSRKDCLITIRNQMLMRAVDLEIEIALMGEMPEDKIVGEKATSSVIAGMQGKVAVRIKEELEVKKEQLAAFNNKLEAIDKLLEKC